MTARALLGSAWTLPGLRQLRRSGHLNAWLRKGYGPYWGRFGTAEEARAFLRPAQRLSADDDRLAGQNAEAFSDMHLFDWPVVFALQSMMREAPLTVVTDFGGHVGVKFRAFRRVMAFADDLAWQVVELPAMCREGRSRCLDLPQVSFHEDLAATAPCDVLICSGVLQYADATLDQIVAAMPRKPPVIVLNKVAVSDGKGFHTLESLGFGRIPYRVLAASDLGATAGRLGYVQGAHWAIPDRDVDVPSATGPTRVRMIGEVWRRAADDL